MTQAICDRLLPSIPRTEEEGICPSEVDRPLINGEEGDGPYIGKEQALGMSVLCRSKRAGMVFRAVQPWVRWERDRGT